MNARRVAYFKRDELIEYRNIVHRSPRRSTSRAQTKAASIALALRRSPHLRGWTITAMPIEMQKVTNVSRRHAFSSAQQRRRLQSIFTRHTASAPSPTRVDALESVENGGSSGDGKHRADRCPFCASSSSTPQTVEATADWANRRAEILYTITHLDLRETAFQSRLAKFVRLCARVARSQPDCSMYRENAAVFEQRCLYADALELLTDLSLGAESRSFVQQLFWRCLVRTTQNSSAASTLATAEEAHC